MWLEDLAAEILDCQGQGLYGVEFTRNGKLVRMEILVRELVSSSVRQ